MHLDFSIGMALPLGEDISTPSVTKGKQIVNYFIYYSCIFAAKEKERQLNVLGWS